MSTTIEPTTTPAAPEGAVVTSAPAMTGSAVQNRIAELRQTLAEKGNFMPERATPEVTLQETPQVEGEPAVEGAVQGADGRWRNPDGTFAQPPAADIATDGSESDGEPAADATAPAPEPIVVKVRGRNEDEPELEIEVSDPDVAERLRQNANDGMRRAEYNRQVKALEEDRAQLREIAVMLETSPEAIVEGMAPDRQERVLRYLLASNFEAFRPLIQQWWEDDVARRSSLVDMKDTVRSTREQGNRAAQAERRAAEIRLAVRELVPPTATDQDARDFFTDAINDLTRVAQERGDIDPAAVPDLLKARLARYWGQSAPAPSPDSRTASVAVARPVGPNAEAIAQRAKAQVARTQAAQAARKVAAKVAPQGAGAVPVVVNNQPPKGQTIAERVAWAKANLASVFRK